MLLTINYKVLAIYPSDMIRMGGDSASDEVLLAPELGFQSAVGKKGSFRQELALNIGHTGKQGCIALRQGLHAGKSAGSLSLSIC